MTNGLSVEEIVLFVACALGLGIVVGVVGSHVWHWWRERERD